MGHVLTNNGDDTTGRCTFDVDSYFRKQLSPRLASRDLALDEINVTNPVSSSGAQAIAPLDASRCLGREVAQHMLDPSSATTSIPRRNRSHPCDLDEHICSTQNMPHPSSTNLERVSTPGDLKDAIPRHHSNHGEHAGGASRAVSFSLRGGSKKAHPSQRVDTIPSPSRY